MFTVDITDFVAQECMRDYSASVAEVGPHAGRDTWQACTENASHWQFLKPENEDEFREFLASVGAWDDVDIAAMDLQAMCLQWIAGDVRECGADKHGVDWQQIRKGQENGQFSGAIYRNDETGRIFWECAQ